MTVPTPIQQRIRIPGREGCVLASYIEGGRGVQTDGAQVRAVGGLLAGAPGPSCGGLEARPVQAVDRQVVGGGPVHAAQAAAYGQARV